MTDELTTLMRERAATPHFDPVDLDTLVRDGERRVRRRRAGGAVGALAAAAVVGALVVAPLTAGGDRADGPDRVAEDPPPAAALSWATGSTIHEDGTAVDVGRPVRAYVRTSLGYVFADADGAVRPVAQGRVGDVLGHTDAQHPRLVGDQETGDVGWVDPSGDRPAFVTYDQATGETQRHDEFTEPGMGALADEADPAYLYAVDDGTAYWRDRRGAVAVDLTSGEARVIDARARNGFDLHDAEGGLLALDGDDRGTLIGRSREDALLLPQVYGTMGSFSPGGAFYTGDADEPQVFDAATGEQVALGLSDYRFATGYGWVDADTLEVIAARRPQSGPVTLLTCEVPAGACTPVTELASFDELRDVQLATGTDLYDG